MNNLCPQKEAKKTDNAMGGRTETDWRTIGNDARS